MRTFRVEVGEPIGEPSFHGLAPERRCIPYVSCGDGTR